LSISHIPPLAALSGLIVAVFGPIVALYLVFTRDQRRNIREIRRAAAARGWRYRVRRSQGNPWAFRLDGVTPGGFAWIFTSGNSGEGTHDWSTEATIKFPAPGGEPDFAIMPRGAQRGLPLSNNDTRLESPVMKAIASGSFPLPDPDAREFRSGEPAFDDLYQVFALPDQFPKPPVDRTLARRILDCPCAPTFRVFMMRGRLGFYCQARLPGPPDWTTVIWLVGVAEDFAAILPRAVASTTPPGFLDRIIDACLQ